MKITVLTFLVSQKYNEAFRVIYFLIIREKTLIQISKTARGFIHRNHKGVDRLVSLLLIVTLRGRKV